MDLKSFYKKIDVDSIKNKFPPLSQIKIPKIKSRKIFKSSREDLSQQKTLAMGPGPTTPQSLPPPSAFIDRTPTRISTVSSLMNMNNCGLRDSEISTYRTANSFEAENCPDRPPEQNGDSASGNSGARFSDRCRKTYKDFSEFKIKSIFAKKTVMKKTEIDVDVYAKQYQLELQEEEELENQQEENGYQFQFKEVRRRLSKSSDSISPPDSLASGVPSPIRSELGHLQRNITPPLLARRRNANDEAGPSRLHLQRSLSEDNAGGPPQKPNRSSLLDVTETDFAEDPTDNRRMPYNSGISKLGAVRKSKNEGVASSQVSLNTESVWKVKSIRTRFASYDSDSERKPKKESLESNDESSDHEKKSWKLRNIHLRHAAHSENVQMSSPEGKFSGIKESIKRLNQRKPRRETSAEESEAEHNEEQPSKSNVSSQLKTGLRRLTLKDRSQTFDKVESKVHQSPSNTITTTSKIQNWKKSFKIKRPIEDEQASTSAAIPPGRSSTLMRKLNHIRSRKVGSEDGDESGDPSQIDSQQKLKSSNLEKLEQARDKALRSVNAQVQKMKMFHGKSRDSVAESSPEKPRSTTRKVGSDDRPDKVTAEPPENKRAAWQTNKSFSESLELSSDNELDEEKSKASHFEKFEQARGKALQKMNAQVQKMKMLHGKARDSATESSPEKPRRTTRKVGSDDRPDKVTAEPPEKKRATLQTNKSFQESIELSSDNEPRDEKPKTSNFVKFEQARGKALQKVNAQVQKMKMFHGKSRDSAAESSPEKPRKTTCKVGSDGRPDKVTAQAPENKRAAWKTNKSFSESLELSSDNEAHEEKSKTSEFEKFDQARSKALQKVNAQVQKIKMFHGKSRDSPTELSPEKPRKATRPFDTDNQPDMMIAELPKSTHAVWTTKKSFSESFELSHDDDVEIPRLLIHQDNSDQYESTLIIAVTRPAPPVPSTVIKEIIPKTKAKSEWIPNKNAISSFLEMTPSPPPTCQHMDINRGHLRKRSMDSSDSDSWIPDGFRSKNCTSSNSACLNKINENSPEPWKVHSVFSEERLYKARSIDIFANRDGSAFVDFDDEMKNVPVRRIAASSADSLDKSFGESTDDDDDYDNSSRITRVKRESPLVSTKAAIEPIRSESIKSSIDSNKASHGSPLNTKKGQIGNSQESLDANYDENEEMSSEDDDDEPPTMAPSPPPSFSPPPPPLPLRKPPRNLPERNESMVRLAKPLVKQESLRRHFSEEIEPSDLGKVNKLICRFEKNPSQENETRIQVIASDNEMDDEVPEKKPIKTKEEPKNGNGNKKRPAPVPKQLDVEKVHDSKNNNNEAQEQSQPQDTASPEMLHRKNLDNASIQSPRSEYGSPMGSMCLSERISTSSEYGSPIGVAYPTKTMDQLHANRRLSNRSSLRDDDTFYSFESDEENNFYSFGESSSTRYTIEI